MKRQYRARIIKSTTTILIILCVLILSSGCTSDSIKSSKKASASKSKKSVEKPKKPNKFVDELGVCDLVSFEVIKSALGRPGENVVYGEATKIRNLGNGDKGSSCLFPFEKAGSITNSFYIETEMRSQESFENLKVEPASTGESIANVGNKARYVKSELSSGEIEHVITAIKGSNIYRFAIRQAKQKMAIDDQTAKNALTKIAKSARLK